MKKSIYKITNLINNKVYIGQSSDPNRRFLEHSINYGSKGGKDNKKSLINFAIRKYGKENFILEILESNIENYNEREQYWISFFNSKTPNGYNISSGGDNPPYKIGTDNPNTSHTKEEIEEIKYLLEFTDIPIKDIAQMYHYANHSTIGFINEGKNWRDENRIYPIRVTNCSKNLPIDKVLCIITDLQETTLTQQDIADKYKIGRHIVTAINIGESYKQKELTYPIRPSKAYKKKKKNLEEIQCIIKDLQNSDLTLTDIAKKHYTSVASISNINQGKSYKQKDIEYPIKKIKYKKSS